MRRTVTFQAASTARRSRQATLAARLAGAAGLLTSCGLAPAQLVFWNSPQDGSWYDPLKWNSGTPGSGADAQLGWTDPYTVTVSAGSASCRNLTISNPNAVLKIANSLSSSRAELWTYGGLFSNAGSIVLGAQEAPYTARLIINAPTTLAGPGVLRLAGEHSTPGSSPTITGYFGLGWDFIQAADHRIEGVGSIKARLINDGLVDANVPGHELVLDAVHPVQNNGTIRASGGSAIRIATNPNGFGFVQGPSGELVAEENSAVVLQIAGIEGLTGGSLTTIGSGAAHVSAQGFPIQDLTITSGSQLRIGTNLGIHIGPPGLTNHGLIRSSGFVASKFGQPATLFGTGRLQLESGYFGKFLDAYSYTIINAPGHTVGGVGNLNSYFTNRGVVMADRNGLSSGPTDLVLQHAPKLNEGLMSATGGGNLVLNSVTITQSASGTLHAGDSSSVLLADATVIGGTLSTSGSGLITGTSGTGDTLDGVTIAPGSSLVVVRCRELVAGAAGIENHGVITIGSGTCGAGFSILRAPGGAIIGGSGELRLNAAAPASNSSVLTGDGGPSQPLVIGPEQRVTGSGRFAGTVRVQGTLSPDQTVAGSGPIGFAECVPGAGGNTLVLESSATFTCDLASPTRFDAISGSGAITLAGTLRLTLLNGFVPAAHDSFDVIVGSSVAGAFDTIIVEPQPPSGTLRATYLPDRVRITTCYSDFNRDGQSDFFDYLDFVAALDAGEADFNGDSQVDFFDYLDFAAAFDAGCE